MEQMAKYAESVLEELGTYFVPGYSFVALLIVGLFFLFVGARICKGLVAGICFVGGGVAGYSLSDNIAIAVVSGIGAAVIGLIVQYVVVVILAGLAVAGTATLVAYLMGQESIAGAFAIGGFLVGAILAVRLYRILLIFGTAALGAACVAASGLVLLDETLRPEMTQYVNLGGICLDPYKFSIAFFALLAAGVVAQAASYAFRTAARERAP
jgi:hypothetical protein